MFKRILVVCDGNICRSPTAAAMFMRHCPDRDISSAGLIGLAGHEMDETARQVAAEHGLYCPPHQGRRLNTDLCRQADLILVMQRRQRDELMSQFPIGSGKVMLLGHWCGGEDIPDPYRHDLDTFEHVYQLIDQAVTAWLPRL
jgi:protein-tyrosine phosphatase